MTQRRKHGIAVRTAAGLALGTLLFATPALAGGEATTTQVDVGLDGPPDGASRSPAISADGRHVAFISRATNLVEGDETPEPGFGVYVRDLATGSTRLVSGSHTVDSYPNPRVSISADGWMVAFDSLTSNQLLVKDLEIGETHVATVGIDGHGWWGEAPSISADGRYVAFTSSASKLVQGDTNQNDDIFVRDLEAGVTRRLSVGWTGAEANGDSHAPSISADGRFVAFTSGASNLIRRDTNRRPDVFVRNLETGTTRRVSLRRRGAQRRNRSRHPSISADGRKVAFSSGSHVLVRNRKARRTRRVSVGRNGSDPNGGSSAPAISADGRLVAFTSGASNLVKGDRNGYTDIFVRDLSTGETRLVSLGEDGAHQSRSSFQPSISADGRFVAFTSFAYRPPFAYSGWGGRVPTWTAAVRPGARYEWPPPAASRPSLLGLLRSRPGRPPIGPLPGVGVRPNVVVVMTDDQTVEQMRVMRRTRSLIGDRGIRADPFQLHSRRHADSALAELRAQQAGRLAELRDCGGPSCRS